MRIFNWFIFGLLVTAFYTGQLCYGQKAVWDLKKEWNTNEILPIKNNWEFYWNKLLTPTDFKNKKLKPDAMLVAGSWGDVQLNGNPIGNKGYATYRLTLINLPEEELALDIYSVQTSCRVFIDDKLAVEVGKPGISQEETVPMNRDVQVNLPKGADTVQLIVHIANFHHRKGGFVHPFEIGLTKTINDQHTLYYHLDFIESTALMVIGLFLFAMYIFRRKDLSILYFALFCITLSFRPVTSVNYLLATIFENINWSLLLKIEYLSVLFPCLFMLLFIKKLFPAQLPNILVVIIKYILLIKITVVVLFPPAIFSWIILPLLFVITFGVLIFIITIIRALLAKVEGANYAGIGIIILLVSLILKVMTYSGIIPPIHVLITVMDIGFIFTMSLILGSRFSLQFSKVELLQRQTELQHQEIERKKEQVEKQKELVEEKNKEILDSISYAKRIQQAILPSEISFKQALPGSFILYKPKDIVAGDFYWMEKIEDRSNSFVLFAAADCTGHGVPGALVSVVCSNALTRCVKEFNLTDPGKILDKCRELVVETFDKSGQDVKDGMDISLCCLQYNATEKPILSWAGANNALLYSQNKEWKEIVPDKQPIGKTDHPKPFTTHTLTLEKNDFIFLYTDGYADQFGGPKGKKFRYRKMNEVFAEVRDSSPEIQKQRLNDAFEEWRGDLEQVDDVCIIGVRL